MAIMQFRHESAPKLVFHRSIMWEQGEIEVWNATRPGFRRALHRRMIVALCAQRARVRTWKTSKLSSATCHQRYWSERKAAMASIAFLKSGFLAEISA